MLIWIQGAKWIRIRHKKLNFYMRNILQVGNRSTNIPTKVQKPFFKAEKPCLFFNFGQFPCSWIRLRVPNTDPDPQPNQCEFESNKILTYLPALKNTRTEFDPFLNPLLYCLYMGEHWAVPWKMNSASSFISHSVNNKRYAWQQFFHVF